MDGLCLFKVCYSVIDESLMTETFVLELTEKCMMLVLMLSLPPILVATILGLVVSLGQALTQLQEQTLGFAVKLVGVIVVLAFFGEWIMGQLLQFTFEIFNDFYLLVR